MSEACDMDYSQASLPLVDSPGYRLWEIMGYER